MLRNIKENLSLYTHKNILFMLPLGMAAGIVLPLLLGTLSTWLRELDIARSSITMLGWIALTYSIKWIFAPLVDNIKLPLLHTLFGKRRSWLLFTQIGMITGICMIATAEPAAGFSHLIYAALLTALFAAMYDIALDAYRIEAAASDEQAAMSANYILGYRIGMLISGAFALVICTQLETLGLDVNTAWSITYLIMAIFICIASITVLIIQEPPKSHIPADKKHTTAGNSILHNALAWLYRAAVMPFIEFFKRYKHTAIIILLLIATYRISDIVLGSIAQIFYLDIGFTKLEIASISKIYGTIFTLLGAFIGGLWVNRAGVFTVLIWGAILCAATNLGFVYLNYIGANTSGLTLVITIDNLSAGLATVAFIAYLSSLVNKQYTATQYAIFSSFMTILPKFFAGFSGTIVDSTDYPTFFIFTSVIGIPVVALIIYAKKLSSSKNQMHKLG